MKKNVLLQRGLVAILLLGAGACVTETDRNAADGVDGSVGGARASVELESILAEIDRLKQQLAELEQNKQELQSELGGAGSSADLDAVLADIDRLKQQLNAAEADRQQLDSKLQDALSQLEEMQSPSCGTGGECTALSDTVDALLPLSDAYCEWIFGCCSADETQSVGAAAMGSVAQCKATLAELIVSGNASINLQTTEKSPDSRIRQVEELLSGSIPVVAGLLQKGTLTVNSDAVTACAAWITSLGCADDSTAQARQCSTSPIAECQDLFVGQQVAGGECDMFSECEDGYVCGTQGYGYGLAVTRSVPGICIPQPKVDSLCISNWDCETPEHELFCDSEVGACALRPNLGEACALSDPTFAYGGPWSTRIPCAPGLACSPGTQTCVAACAEGAPCYQPDSSFCSSGFCNVTQLQESTYLPYYYGFCDAGGNGGEVRNYTSECKSHELYNSKCRGVGGESCSSDNECATRNCDSGHCTTYCGDDSSACAAGQFCADSECQDKVAADGDCPNASSLACPPSQFCKLTNAGTTGYQCRARIALNGACTGNSSVECADGSSCEAGYCAEAQNKALGENCVSGAECASGRCDYFSTKCVAGLAEGANCDASMPDNNTILNTNPEWDDCEAGLFCAQNAPGSADFSGTCKKQAAPGASCDANRLHAPQCQGDVSCVFQSQRANYVCPVLEESNSCVLAQVPYATGY